MQTLKTLMLIRISTAANILIYYAQKLPLIGGSITDSVYQELAVKRVFSIIGFLLSIIWGIGSRLAFVGLMIALPITLAQVPEEEQAALLYHLFAWLGLVAAGYSNAKMLEPTREKYTAIRLMRMDPGRYMRLFLSYRYLTFGLYYLIALLLFAAWSPLLTMREAVALTACVTLFRLAAEYIHLWFFQRNGQILIKNQPVYWLVLLISFGLGYAPFFTSLPPFGKILVSWPVMLLIAVPGLAAAIYLLRYRKYRSVLEASTRRDDPLLNWRQMVADEQIRVVEAESGLQHTQLNKGAATEHLTGYAYLDKLFFTRYPNIIRKSLQKKLIGLAIGLSVLCIVAAVHGPTAASISQYLLLWFPVILLLPQFFMLGEQTCRSLFFNCDRSLMAYSFYRQAAIQHFRLRLIRFIRINLLVGMLLAGGISVLLFVSGGSAMFPAIGWTWLTMVCMAVFNAVHHLLMYYLLQPYSTSLNVKNPYFITINMIYSGAIGFCIAGRVAAAPLSIGLLVLTVAYFLASMILIRKYAVRTFRLR